MKKSVIFLILLVIAMPLSFANNEKIYIYGGDGLVASKEGDDITYYNQDFLGSNKIISDEDGDIISKNVQYPFGEDYSEKGSKEGLDNNYKFTGQEEDEDLYYYGARYYDPLISRFISVDPIFDFGISPYAYVGNNPLKYVDPSGKKIQIMTNNVEELRLISKTFSKLIGGSKYITIRGYNEGVFLELTQEYNGKFQETFSFLKEVVEHPEVVELYLFEKGSPEFGNFIPKKKLVLPEYKFSESLFGVGEVQLDEDGKLVSVNDANEVWVNLYCEKEYAPLGANGKNILFTPTIILTHELLGHARGYLVGLSGSDYGERPAIDVENIYRDEAGHDLRYKFKMFDDLFPIELKP
ncbi:MAG: RHS repeat-associated core domain-containing protein [Candidatus Woesearchaeota archaeon]